ncbi:MAG: ketol-acid reductoisomerase [Alphaproteobacteria bacterium]|nr:ketol-acid reductoisomerase [Alphaproteobacteria bacterium]
MAKFHFDADADLGVLKGRTVAVLGYGNQGRSQALNLKDCGVDVIVGNRDDDYAANARKDGWDLLSLPEAARRADVKLFLVSDDAQPEVFERDIAPSLKPNDVLSFAHGFTIHYGEIVPLKTIDVVMVAPRMLGEGVRQNFVSGRGYPSFVAVHQDASGKAMATCLAIAKGIGSTKMGVLESSFEEEVLIDLFEEHQPGLYALRCMYQALVEAGCSPEAVMLDLYASGESVKWAEAGRDYGAFERMKIASHTAQYGHLVWSKQYFDEARTMDGMRAMIANIRNGSFMKALREQKRANMRAVETTTQENDAHPMMIEEEKLYRFLGRRSGS